MNDGERTIRIPSGRTVLTGDLSIPADVIGFVLFAHGSGSSRLSARNPVVARHLQESRLATMLVDLLTEEEEWVDLQTMEFRFNIGPLAERLIGLTDWQATYEELSRLPLGYFGASTGSAAALVAAAERPDRIRAVVSRGGRPDLAAGVLRRVQTPTLLIVGGQDIPVIELNRSALETLQGEKRLEIVPGATHLFEEPGALETVGRLAREWFHRYME